MNVTLRCWHCGTSLAGVPLPISRREVCPACENDLHVCTMCRQLDMTAAKNCREPTVDEVRDKQRSNFCDLFSPDPGAYARDPEHGARQARQDLQALFGVQSETPAQDVKPDPGELLKQREDQADKARSELEDIFGLGKK